MCEEVSDVFVGDGEVEVVDDLRSDPWVDQVFEWQRPTVGVDRSLACCIERRHLSDLVGHERGKDGDAGPVASIVGLV